MFSRSRAVGDYHLVAGQLARARGDVGLRNIDGTLYVLYRVSLRASRVNDDRSAFVDHLFEFCDGHAFDAVARRLRGRVCVRVREALRMGPGAPRASRAW